MTNLSPTIWQRLSRFAQMAGVMLWWMESTMMGALSPETREYPIMGELSGHQQEPCLAFGSKGSFMVWHHDSGKEGSPGRLVIQSLNRGMVGMGLPVPLSQAPEGTREAHPSIALLMDGGAVIAWETGPRVGRDVLVRFVSSLARKLVQL